MTLEFKLMALRQVIADIEQKKANSFSIEKLNTLQHILLHESNKTIPFPSLYIGNVYRDERLNYITDMCCRKRKRY
jgi:hypothetical protein